MAGIAGKSGRKGNSYEAAQQEVLDGLWAFAAEILKTGTKAEKKEFALRLLPKTIPQQTNLADSEGKPLVFFGSKPDGTTSV